MQFKEFDWLSLTLSVRVSTTEILKLFSAERNDGGPSEGFAK